MNEDYSRLTGIAPPGSKSCPQCEGTMFPYIDPEIKTSYPPIYTWRWKCIDFWRCQHTEWGGSFRPLAKRRNLEDLFCEKEEEEEHK